MTRKPHTENYQGTMSKQVGSRASGAGPSSVMAATPPRRWPSGRGDTDPGPEASGKEVYTPAAPGALSPARRGRPASLALTHPRGALPSPSLHSPAVTSAGDSTGWTLCLQPVCGEQPSNPRWRPPAPLPQTLSRLPEALAGVAAAEGAWQQPWSRRGVAAQLVALKGPTALGSLPSKES